VAYGQLVNIYGYLFRYFGWLLGILVLFGQVTFWADGTVDGWMRALGGLILAAWAYHVYRLWRSNV
jgi:hypothetical protein